MNHTWRRCRARPREQPYPQRLPQVRSLCNNVWDKVGIRSAVDKKTVRRVAKGGWC